MDIPPIAAVEIGTSRIRVAIGEVHDDDHLQVIGVGECPSRGIRKGEIIDMDAALSCLRIALHQAEEASDTQIKAVYVPVTGGHVQSMINRGSIPIVGDEPEIHQEHIDDVQEIAKAVNLPNDRELIHSICQYYYLDDQKGVINPLGMEASKLAVDVMIVHGHSGRIRNLNKLMRSLHLDVDDCVLAGLCSALAVLQPEEKENGALVIDLGGGTTDFLGYADSTIAVAGSLAIGGDHISNDVARGLRMSIPNAERVKEASGSAIIHLASRLQKLDLPGDTGPDGRVVRLGDVQLITSLRAEEILTMVKSHVEEGDLLQRFGSGIVLTGGGAHLDRIDELASKVFGMPCRIGKSRDVSGLATTANRPEYATVIGLLRYAARAARRQSGTGRWSNLLRRILSGEG